MKRKLGKPMRVLGMPTFTVGVDKEVCKGLLALGDKFPFAKRLPSITPTSTGVRLFLEVGQM
jgi:hypothetical protein